MKLRTVMKESNLLGNCFLELNTRRTESHETLITLLCRMKCSLTFRLHCTFNERRVSRKLYFFKSIALVKLLFKAFKLCGFCGKTRLTYSLCFRNTCTLCASYSSLWECCYWWNERVAALLIMFWPEVSPLLRFMLRMLCVCSLISDVTVEV